MEKAKLIIKETKKKKLAAELCFEEGKKKNMPFQDYKSPDISLDGSIVEVEREKGKIVKVVIDNRVLFSTVNTETAVKNSASASHSTNWKEVKHIKNVRYPASAPYNFIPLNKEVVEISRDDIPAFKKIDDKEKGLNTYWSDRHTGWIKLDIETKTPIYIRDALTPEEMKKQQEAEKEDKRYINPDFFSPGGRLRIPGSSLRGMVRNLVEIVSFGKFENFNDKRLYYRGLADKSNLRTEYQQKMSSYDSKKRKAIYKAFAGLLKKEGLNYFIVPSNYKPVILDEDERKEKGYKPFNFYKLAEGYLVVSGPMQKKKRDWLIAFPGENVEIIEIPEEDVKNYNDDITRGKEAPPLIQLAGKNEEVPCFYVTWKDSNGKKRVAFGHTPMFRLAYEKTIGEHIPVAGFRIDDDAILRLENTFKEKKNSQNVLEQIKRLEKKEYTEKQLIDKLESLKPDKKDIDIILNHTSLIDFTEAIFGNEKTFAGRVFFEDAFLGEGQKEEDVSMGKLVPMILSNPKPTTFQHYLLQTSDEIKDINTYNSGAPIRGYKLYWHKTGKRWQEEDKEIVKSMTAMEGEEDTQHTVINPVGPGTRFTGSIRFENLSGEELGALLFALDLPDGCCHKIGMGKPLGLGSINIKPTLYISKRAQRYSSLFAEWGKTLEDSLEKSEIEEFKAAFSSGVIKEIIPSKNMNDLWQLDRLQDLKSMLDFENKPGEKETGYMKIEPENEFKDRHILPGPKELIK